MAWIDYKKAYDMVPHSWIKEYLGLFRVAENTRTLFVNSIQKWRVMLYARNSKLTEVDIKVLEYLHRKNESFKNDFFLGHSFPIGLRLRKNMLFNKNNAFKRNTSLFCFSMICRATFSQVKLDNIWFLFKFNLTPHIIRRPNSVGSIYKI